jgi:hypothetical protein
MSSESGSPRCLNCGADLSGSFCSKCGQEDLDLRVSLGSLVRDLFADQFGLESKVPRTLWALISKPGLLTREYLAGHRVRWLLPFKLYLSVSVVYFLLLSLPFLGSMRTTIKYTDTDRAAMDSARVEADSISANQRSGIVTIGGTVSDSALTDSTATGAESLIQRRSREIASMSQADQVDYFKNAFVKYMPNAVFLLLPVFALLLYLLYRKTGRFYAEHLIFTLHFHAFAFVALTVNLLLPDALGIVAPVWILVYLYLGLRRVYGESRGRTAGKFVGLLIPYALILQIVTFGVLFAVFALG